MKEQNFTLRFLRLFPEYRRLEKKAESDAALIDSMNRYIEALEGRDRERLSRIEELENKNLGLLKHLSGVMPPE